MILRYCLFCLLLLILLLTPFATASAQPNLALGFGDVFGADGSGGCLATVAVVHNDGDAPSGPFTLRFGISNDTSMKTAETVVSNLNPGKQQILWSCFYGSGWKMVWAVADVYGQVAESDEGDNFHHSYDQKFNMGAGESQSWTVGIPNPGDDAESVAISIPLPGPGWAVSASPASFSLGPGGVQLVSFTVQTPSDFKGGSVGILVTADFTDGTPGPFEFFVSINPPDVVEVPVAVKPSTWGRVKALYRD